MSRAIQIRRGSADEHSNFTGLLAEVTYDTTNKTLRVHDGKTVGGTILAKQIDIPSMDAIISATIPDYTSGVECTFNALTTAPECGYFEITGCAYNNAYLTIELNGVLKKIATSTNSSFSTTGYVLIPVKTGDTVKGISSYNNTGKITFYKLNH